MSTFREGRISTFSFPTFSIYPTFGLVKDERFQLARLNGDFFRDPLPDLGDEFALMVRDLPFIEFLPRDDFLRPFRQEQQVAEIGGAQRDGNDPAEKEFLAFIHEDGRVYTEDLQNGRIIEKSLKIVNPFAS